MSKLSGDRLEVFNFVSDGAGGTDMTLRNKRILSTASNVDLSDMGIKTAMNDGSIERMELLHHLK